MITSGGIEVTKKNGAFTIGPFMEDHNRQYVLGSLNEQEAGDYFVKRFIDIKCEPNMEVRQKISHR